MVTWENYEEYLVMQADGELDAAGEAALEAFLQEHPELREEQALYAKVRIVPDTTVVYEGKESLLKRESRVIGLGNWRQYSAAAGILLLVALGLMKWNGEGTTTTIGKVEDTAAHVSTPQIAAVDTPRPVQEEQIAVEEKPAPQVPTPQRQMQQVQVATVKERISLPKVNLPERIESTDVGQLAVAQVEKPAVELTDIPELPQINEPAPEPYRDALAWLPVSNERKQGLTEIKHAMDRRFEKVKELSNNVKNTDLGVKLGKKEIFTIRF